MKTQFKHYAASIKNVDNFFSRLFFTARHTPCLKSTPALIGLAPIVTRPLPLVANHLSPPCPGSRSRPLPANSSPAPPEPDQSDAIFHWHVTRLGVRAAGSMVCNVCSVHRALDHVCCAASDTDAFKYLSDVTMASWIREVIYNSN